MPKIVMVSLAVMATLFVSGCCGFDEIPYPEGSMSPTAYAPSPSPSPSQTTLNGSTMWGANSFIYEYISKTLDNEGNVIHDYTMTREYTYEDVTLPDGSPGYKMTLKEWFKPGNGNQYTAYYKADNTFVSGTLSQVMNFVAGNPQQTYSGVVNRYNPKALNGLNGDLFLEGAETPVGIPFETLCNRFESSDKKTTVWYDGAKKMPVMIRTVSTCGTMVDEYRLMEYRSDIKF